MAGAVLAAQGVTTGAIAGVVTDAQKQPVAGAQVIAIHLPSGHHLRSARRARTADSRFPACASAVRTRSPSRTRGTGPRRSSRRRRRRRRSTSASRTDLHLRRASDHRQETVTVTAHVRHGVQLRRTGAATSVSRAEIATLPTISGRIDDITRLTPQASGMSFAGQDNRLNNITVDGSYFNNSFGLGGAARRPHRRRADLARSDRADPGERRAVRRAAGQLRRRRRQHRHAQRHQPLHRVALPPDPQRGLRRHRGARALPFNPGDVQLPQHRRLGAAGRSSRTNCSPSATTRTKRTAGRSQRSAPTREASPSAAT